jgi:hypothetical protein
LSDGVQAMSPAAASVGGAAAAGGGLTATISAASAANPPNLGFKRSFTISDDARVRGGPDSGTEPH